LVITQAGLHGFSIGVEVEIEIELCNQFIGWNADDWSDCWMGKTITNFINVGRYSYCCWCAFERLGVAFERWC
jgi:hypothetical protein